MNGTSIEKGMSWKEAVRVLISIELNKTNKRKFTLESIYSYEAQLKKEFTKNKNIKAKIRQTLQYLRDNSEIVFVEPGVYKKIGRSM